jgi:RNA polymerase sigma factor (TIGR02999 family)
MSHLLPRDQLDEILPQVYRELHRCASRALDGERDNHSFQTTELIHETYVRLAKLDRIEWANKDHVIRAAVCVMRHVLIDYARARNARKRDEGQLQLHAPTRGFSGQVDSTPDLELLALDDALKKLANFDERKAHIVELRYFGGQHLEDIARILSVSVGTVKRDWALARAWLLRELGGASAATSWT